MKKLSNATFNLPKVTHVWVYAIAAIALLLRLVFILSGFDELPGERGLFRNSDSFSYSQAFLNWWEQGVYSFDLANEGAKYGRLPGYPLFWGLHYVIFGPGYVYAAVAVTQALLDSLVCIMLFRILTTLNLGRWPAFMVALLYALNPFAIYWVPLTGTEALGVFISIWFMDILVRKGHKQLYPVYLGLIGASAFYIREYLAVLMLSAVLYILWTNQPRPWRKIIFAALSFWMVAGIWQVRNYQESGELIWVKKAGSGYHRYAEDVSAARVYIFTWSPEFDYYMDEVFNQEGNYTLPPEAIPSTATAAEVKATISRAFECGSGFHFWHGRGAMEGTNCNREVAAAFRTYKDQLYKDAPLRSRLYVPAINLRKAFFKQVTVKPKYPNLERVFFGARTTVMLLSVVGLWMAVYGKRWDLVSLGVLPVFMYFYVTTLMRQVEMRYLLQADAVMWIFLGYMLCVLWKRWLIRSARL